MPNRNFSAGSYRYGFNGKENDPETGTQDYGMRIYNPNLGKFLSVDPLAKEYPWNSAYAFAENDVIRCIDVEGAEKYKKTVVIDAKSKALLVEGDIETISDDLPHPLGEGLLVEVIKRSYYENGMASWDDADPAANQYIDEVIVTPPFNLLDEAKDFLMSVDASVKGDYMSSTWLEGGHDGGNKGIIDKSDIKAGCGIIAVCSGGIGLVTAGGAYGIVVSGVTILNGGDDLGGALVQQKDPNSFDSFSQSLTDNPNAKAAIGGVKTAATVFTLISGKSMWMLDELGGKGFDLINGVGVANDTFGMSYDVIRAASSSGGTSSDPVSTSAPASTKSASKSAVEKKQ